MEKVLEEKVVNQLIDGKPMENAMADLYTKIDRQQVELERAKTEIAVLKQLNIRHGNLIVAALGYSAR